ncbi:MAG: archease [Candidatus Omnitrophica bacterium]|nr:archease [Candidatus Omnitrophota bacterium]
MPYEYLDDIATADVAFKVWADSLEDLFQQAAEAMMKVIVERMDRVDAKEEREIVLEDDSQEMLLFQFLQEFIYYKDAENLILKLSSIHLEHKGDVYGLKGILAGEVLDPQRHRFQVDIKAVTIHQFYLRQTDHGWECLVVVDV